jgi:hypothetical protein
MENMHFHGFGYSGQMVLANNEMVPRRATESLCHYHVVENAGDIKRKRVAMWTDIYR